MPRVSSAWLNLPATSGAVAIINLPQIENYLIRPVQIELSNDKHAGSPDSTQTYGISHRVNQSAPASGGDIMTSTYSPHVWMLEEFMGSETRRLTPPEGYLIGGPQAFLGFNDDGEEANGYIRFWYETVRASDQIWAAVVRSTAYETD